MTFDNEPEVIQDFTGDLSLLTDAIRDQRAGGGTALNDAIYRASEKLSNPPLPTGPNPEVRRVIVVISDGDDNLSDHALSDAIEAAIRAEAAIYTISTNTDWLAIDGRQAAASMHLEDGDKILQQFADQTGGRVLFPLSRRRSCAVVPGHRHRTAQPVFHRLFAHESALQRAISQD